MQLSWLYGNLWNCVLVIPFYFSLYSTFHSIFFQSEFEFSIFQSSTLKFASIFHILLVLFYSFHCQIPRLISVMEKLLYISPNESSFKKEKSWHEGIRRSHNCLYQYIYPNCKSECAHCYKVLSVLMNPVIMIGNSDQRACQ